MAIGTNSQLYNILKRPKRLSVKNIEINIWKIGFVDLSAQAFTYYILIL